MDGYRERMSSALEVGAAWRIEPEEILDAALALLRRVVSWAFVVSGSIG